MKFDDGISMPVIPPSIVSKGDKALSITESYSDSSLGGVTGDKTTYDISRFLNISANPSA